LGLGYLGLLWCEPGLSFFGLCSSLIKTGLMAFYQPCVSWANMHRAESSPLDAILPATRSQSVVVMTTPWTEEQAQVVPYEISD